MASTLKNCTVSFGLVSFPAALRKASDKKDVKFETAVRTENGTNAKGDKLYTYDKVVQARGASSGDGGVLGQAATETIVKGIWVDETTFHPVPEGSLEAITEDTQIEGIEIQHFIKLADLPTERIEGAYYLAPQKGLLGAKPMRLLADAMKAEKAAGCAMLTLKGSVGRQRLGVIRECGGKLIVNLLVFEADWRQTDESAEALANVETDRALVKMARQFVSEGLVEVDKSLITTGEDAAIALREQLYADTFDKPLESFKVTPRAEQPEHANDLMAALEASLSKVKALA